MRAMNPSELRLLTRLAIDPSLRQAGLARNLHVTRSAVNQIWQNLEHENELKIRGNLDHGKVGLQMVFGWAIANEESDVLEKFHRWLKSSRLVTLALRSLISSTFNSLVYFEALAPLDSQYGWFQSQIDRFRKKPYALTIYTCDCSKISHHLNLGLFDGTNWDFPESREQCRFLRPGPWLPLCDGQLLFVRRGFLVLQCCEQCHKQPSCLACQIQC